MKRKTWKRPVSKLPRKETKCVANSGRPPLERTRSATPEVQLGEFPELNWPGITVQGTTVLLPAQELPAGVRVAITSKSAAKAQQIAGQLMTAYKTTRQLSAAKSRYYLRMTQTIYEAYRGMWKWYRYYRTDSLFRGRINALAYRSTKEGAIR
jgi:hypothetical protein